MLRHSLFIFGEAEKGDFCVPYICNSIKQLMQLFGNKGSSGIEAAIQAILLGRDCIFFRVHEEGFSREDYFKGFNVLRHNQILGNLSAICMPGVGDQELIHASLPLCDLHGSLLIVKETDMFDYLLTSRGNTPKYR